MDDEFTNWVAIEPGQKYLRFSELPRLLALALWPIRPENEEFDFHYGAARLNFEAELPQAVQDRRLQVLDPLTRGPHTHPFGPMLESAVVDVDHLREYLRPRRIGVREPLPEDPSQRRHRLLQTWKEEVSRGGETGALQRVYEREKALRPTADRSNIGKDIKKAQKEEAELSRSGAPNWASAVLTHTPIVTPKAGKRPGKRTG